LSFGGGGGGSNPPLNASTVQSRLVDKSRVTRGSVPLSRPDLSNTAQLGATLLFEILCVLPDEVAKRRSKSSG